MCDGGHGVALGFPAEYTGLVKGVDIALGPDFQVFQRSGNRMLRCTDVGEGEILSAYPVVGGVLGCAADVVVVHGSQFLAVDPEIDHVGAVALDFVSQGVDMAHGIVDAVVRQQHAVVVILTVAMIAQCNQAAAGTAVKEIIVGIAITSVIEVSHFITLFNRLSITAEISSRVESMILRYMFVISIA